MSLAEPVRLAEEQVAATGAVLARAFANDPFFTYVLSDPVERERLTPPFMTAWTRYGLLFGEVYVTVGPVEACAIWLPPSAVIGRTEERSDRLFAFIEHGLDSRRSHLTVLYYCTIVLIQYEEEMTPEGVAVGVLRA
jgi:hypothetical protein